MNGDWVAAIVSVAFFLTTGGVILLRPIARRLGEYLEVLIEEKRAGQRAPSGEPVRRTVEGLEQRIAFLEERLDFAENLLGSPGREGSPQKRVGSSIDE